MARQQVTMRYAIGQTVQQRIESLPAGRVVGRCPRPLTSVAVRSGLKSARTVPKISRVGEFSQSEQAARRSGGSAWTCQIPEKIGLASAGNRARHIDLAIWRSRKPPASAGSIQWARTDRPVQDRRLTSQG